MITLSSVLGPTGTKKNGLSRKRKIDFDIPPRIQTSGVSIPI